MPSAGASPAASRASAASIQSGSPPTSTSSASSTARSSLPAAAGVIPRDHQRWKSSRVAGPWTARKRRVISRSAVVGLGALDLVPEPDVGAREADLLAVAGAEAEPPAEGDGLQVGAEALAELLAQPLVAGALDDRVGELGARERLAAERLADRVDQLHQLRLA